jgi:hypothetical protein
VSYAGNPDFQSGRIHREKRKAYYPCRTFDKVQSSQRAGVEPDELRQIMSPDGETPMIVRIIRKGKIQKQCRQCRRRSGQPKLCCALFVMARIQGDVSRTENKSGICRTYNLRFRSLQQADEVGGQILHSEFAYTGVRKTSQENRNPLDFRSVTTTPQRSKTDLIFARSISRSVLPVKVPDGTMASFTESWMTKDWLPMVSER